MRRPVKPFVTEYRGSARRQGPGGSASKPDFSNFDMEQPAPEPRAEPRPSLSARHAEAQEDSYEAAMRAADALFSARQPAPAAAETAPSGDAPHAGGRVLRVLDEAPSPEMVRLEAEHAPKRRGRKPGSKNKPKIAPDATQAALQGSTNTGSTGDAWDLEAWREDAQNEVATEDDASHDDEVWEDEDEAQPTVAVPRPNGHVARPMPTRIRAVALEATGGEAGAPRAGDKYAWVRTKLKPGQQWKRRLPKVAW